MILTPKGNTSTKHSKGRTWKRHIRVEKIARLAATGMFSDIQIASTLNMTVQGLANIKRTPEYQAKIMEITSGVISEHDKDLRAVESNQIAELADMVPGALLKLRSSLLSKNENISFRAATEILDRDGKLAKVSKVNIKHEEVPDLAGITKTSSDIMALLRGSAHIEGSPQNIIDSFTVSAARAGVQVKAMSDNIDEKTLAEIDLSKTRPQ